MEDTFTIDVTYAGKDYAFEGRLTTVGYTHKFYVLINGMEVIYEPDEERNYRAVLNIADQVPLKDSDRELVKLVGVKIQSI